MSRELLARRLRDVDFRIVQAMQCQTMRATAHRTDADARRDVNPITDRDRAGDAWHYRVTYHIKTLLGAGEFSDPLRQPIVLVVDLTGGGNYPFTPPEPKVIGPIVPWSPHFTAAGAVCFQRADRVWKHDGSKTLGHLLLHIARLINFDEHISDATYGGWNPEAIRYWRTRLNAQPITPRLTYPILPDWYFDPSAVAGGAAAAAPAAQDTRTSTRAAVVGVTPAAPRARIVPKSDGG
jgi:hypothetical protein